MTDRPARIGITEAASLLQDPRVPQPPPVLLNHDGGCGDGR